MESDLPATDTLGTFGLPNDVKGSCYTSYDARAYLNTADVGTSVDFVSEEGDFEFSVGRRPGVCQEHPSLCLLLHRFGTLDESAFVQSE